jgi:hypothetical protein
MDGTGHGANPADAPIVELDETARHEWADAGGWIPTMMDVHVLPIGRDRYELYCELPAASGGEMDTPDVRSGAGWFGGLRARFQAMLAVAEAERNRVGGRDPEEAVPARGWAARLRDRTVRSVAEVVAEQRLLWNLRSQVEACLVYPDDLTERQAMAIVRSAMGSDVSKHRLWLGLDSAAFVASGLVALIPGPNLLAYFFAFRLVGHYFSLRGARHGLNGVRWTMRTSAPLTAVRAALALPYPERVGRLQDLAGRLRLRHLVAFVERVAATDA